MPHYRAIRMSGGPKDGQTHRGFEPLAEVICFQQYTIEHGWVVHEYECMGPRRVRFGRRDAEAGLDGPVRYEYLRTHLANSSVAVPAAFAPVIEPRVAVE